MIFRGQINEFLGKTYQKEYKSSFMMLIHSFSSTNHPLPLLGWGNSENYCGNLLQPKMYDAINLNS